MSFVDEVKDGLNWILNLSVRQVLEAVFVLTLLSFSVLGFVGWNTGAFDDSERFEVRSVVCETPDRLVIVEYESSVYTEPHDARQLLNLCERETRGPVVDAYDFGVVGDSR